MNQPFANGWLWKVIKLTDVLGVEDEKDAYTMNKIKLKPRGEVDKREGSTLDIY